MNWDSIKRSIGKQMPVALAAAACVGVCMSVYSAIKATPKAEEKLKDLDEDADIYEKAKAVVPEYTETIIFTTMTVTCIASSSILSKKQQAALVTSYVALERGYYKYKDKLKEYFEDFSEVDGQVRADIDLESMAEQEHPMDDDEDDDLILFFDENYVDDKTGIKGKYFRDTLLHVHDTEYAYNRNLALRGYANWNEFYELLDNDEVPTTNDGYLRGYSLYRGEIDYGYHWVDFIHEEVTTEDGLKCMIIHTPWEPHMDYNW